PADFGVTFTSAFAETGVLNDLLLEINITERYASGHERHQSTESITDAATPGGEIVRSKSGVDTVINVAGRTRKEDRKNTGGVRFAEPQIIAGTFEAEHPLVPLKVVAHQPAQFSATSV